MFHRVYEVSDDDATGDDDSSGSSSGDSDSQKLSKGLVNALIIVGAICGMTFLVVLCYYFRCLKVGRVTHATHMGAPVRVRQFFSRGVCGGNVVLMGLHDALVDYFAEFDGRNYVADCA